MNSRGKRVESRNARRSLADQIKRDKINADRAARGLPPLKEKDSR